MEMYVQDTTDETINIEVVDSDGDRYPYHWRVGSTVLEFKKFLAETSNCPVNEHTLIYKREILEDDRTLESYGIQDFHAVYMELPPKSWFTETETTPPSDTTTGGKMIMIDMICENMDMFSVTSSVGSKVIDFKKLLAQISNIPANEQRLIYRGMTLEDDRTLDSYGVKEYHTIHMEVVLKHPNPDVSLEMSLLLYPAISQMLRTFLSSPQLRKQIIGQNPHLRSVFESNHELTDWIQNHEIVRCLTSPQMMQLSEFPRQSSIRHSTPSEDAAAGPSTSFKAMPPESQLELPRQNSIQHSTLSEDAAADQSTSFKTMAPESQLELPRQNLVQHSTPSEDAAADQSTSFKKMVLVILGASALIWRTCRTSK